MKRFVLLVAASLAAASCAGAGGSGGSSASGPSGPPAFESFPPETQAFMKAGLHQFSAGDPQWDATRAEWIGKGPEATEFLVETMWTALLQSQAMNQPQLVERARHELAMIGEPSVPLMAQFVAGGTIRTTVDEKTGERHDVVVDDLARGEASEVLGLIGAPATSAVRGALENSASKSGKRCALRTLGYIGDRGGAAAYEPVVRYARGDDDVLRVEAVLALRYFHDQTTRSALLSALTDQDDLVRRTAGESLMNRRDASAAPAIREAAQRARGATKLAEADALDEDAAWLEKHSK